MYYTSKTWTDGSMTITRDDERGNTDTIAVRDRAARRLKARLDELHSIKQSGLVRIEQLGLTGERLEQERHLTRLIAHDNEQDILSRTFRFETGELR